VDIIPSPEFAAACRILLSGDTPDIIDAVFRTPPLHQDVKRIKADILAGRRAVSFPLDRRQPNAARAAHTGNHSRDHEASAERR
jgi:hypothetical protein